jgi:CBS domain-containing protein
MLHQKHWEAKIVATTAVEIMTAPAITVLPQASVAEIATLLTKNQISAVPVCGPDGHLMGLISEGDLLRPFRESVRRKRDWWLGLLADGEELSQQYLDYMRIDTRNAEDVMVPHVITTTEDATLPELAELMVNNHVKRLPVLRDGRVVGIVSRTDVLAALAKAPAMLD